MSLSQLDKPSGLPAAEPVLAPGFTMKSITAKIADVVFAPLQIGWTFGFLVVAGIAGLLPISLGWLLLNGVGVWGNNQPVAWAFDIINFVWWIGIGHAGTLISAILYLLNQSWRTSINRFAEAMTLFAVACAGLFPLFHTGRPWFAFWLLPVPNTHNMWPQFRSPLDWDVWAVSTYATVSALFWFVGLIPDLATMRDRAKNTVIKYVFAFLCFGWRGSARHWHRYEVAYGLLAALSTPLVVSVHTIVSFDFATGQTPGWHATIFPPYFVAGAIYSGFAMVITLAIPIRWYYRMEGLITLNHMNNMGKIMLATGLMVGYGYTVEAFFAWYSANTYEKYMMWNRMTGPYAWSYWSLIFCNLICPQFLWSHKVRTNMFLLFVLSIIVNIGMWLERFVILVTSMHRDFLPSSWGMYYPTIWDLALYTGTIGFFLTLMFLFCRLVPMISIAEMKLLLPESKVKGDH